MSLINETYTNGKIFGRKEVLDDLEKWGKKVSILSINHGYEVIITEQFEKKIKELLEEKK